MWQDRLHWALIAAKIHAEYLNYDAFVVLMGTDTMAYCASALSFMLENLSKSVVLTGAQVSFHNIHTTRTYFATQVHSARIIKDITNLFL